MAKGRSRAEPLFWTDEEVELLLQVTLDYKKHKTQENADWESCQSKYSDILEAFRHHYPSTAVETFPQDKHAISKLQVTSKLKAIRYKYRLALHSGRQTGHGRVILIFFDLCKNIWSGSPGSSSPVADSSPGPPALDSSPGPPALDSSPGPPALDSPGTSEATACSLPPPMVRQRRCSIRAKLNRYRRDMRKKRVPAKTAMQKDLQIDRILDLMEASDRRNAEYLQQITSNIATITNTIQDGFLLLEHFMLQQPSMPPHMAYPQGNSEYTQMQAPPPPSPGQQQVHTNPRTPTPTGQTHVVPFKLECGGEEVSTADNQYGMKREEEPQGPPMGIEIKVEPLGEEEGYNPVGQKESTTNSTCPPLFALPSPFNINMDQQEGETEGPTLALMESYRKSRKHPLIGGDEGQFPNAPKVPRLNVEKSKRARLEMAVELKAKISSGEYSIGNNCSSRAKSNVWEAFGVVLDEENYQVAGFAACKRCKKVLAYDSRKLGTSSLKKHTESRCAANATKQIGPLIGAKPINEYLTDNPDLKAPKTEDKETVSQLAVTFVCSPFETVCGDGFTGLAQGLIDIGARAGRVDAAQLLPDPTTISHRVTKYAEVIRQSIIPELKEQLNEYNGAVTLDIWTDDYRDIGYLCHTIHYINSKWELVERVLSTSKWDNTLRKTSDNLKPAIIQALRRYSIEDFFSKLVYVTDKCSNVAAALRTVTRLSCAAHVLNNVLYTTIGQPSQEDAVGEEVIALVNGAKSLVTYFKQTSLQSRLENPLKALVETGWNSIHTMLESISCQYEDVRALLLERGEEDLLNDLSEETLDAMVKFLQRFKEATEALKASKTPTLHLNVVWFHRLRCHLQPCSTDNLTFSSLKEKCLRILLEKYEMHILHKLAMFLHPKLKSLKLLTDKNEVGTVHNEARRLVKDLNDGRGTAQQRVFSSSLPKKRPRLSDGLSDVEDSSSGDESAAQDEVGAYIEFKSPRGENFDLLNWWKEHASVFPNLAHIARSILSIPASSAATERDFSTAGFVIQGEERRSQLKPETVDDILFLHSNLKKH